MIKNKTYGTYPYFIHAAGKLDYCPLWQKIINLELINDNNNDNVKIITWHSLNARTWLGNKKLGTFENSIKKFGLQSIALGSNIIEWKNIYKINLTIEFLENTDAQLIIGGDSSDVLMVKNLGNIINEFESYDCDLLFNAEKLFWPSSLQYLKKFEESVSHTPFCYLNGGLWIGKRKTTLNFFKKAAEISQKIENNTSEQFCLKLIYKDFYPSVKVDYLCKIFQNINRVNNLELEIK